MRLIEPEILKDFFNNIQYYIKDETYIGNIKRFASEGIVSSEGNQWKASRRLFSEAFHFDNIQKLTPLIQKIADQVLNEVVEKGKLNSFDPFPCMLEITGRAVIAAFFGETLENEKFKGLTII